MQLGPVTPMKVQISCPVCGKKPIQMFVHVHNIPYFKKVSEVTIICENCGFKHTDVIILEEKKPRRYELEISSEEDMMIRVVRSSSATIRIPELGVTIEPGPKAQGFVSNVEGVLDRVLNVLEFLEQAETEESKLQRINELKEKIERIKNGREKATLIIDDPTGNSAIISKKAKVRRLSDEELKSLKFGYLIIDAKEIAKSLRKESHDYSNR